MADAYNATTPTDAEKARFGSAELRAIKARMDTMVGVNVSGVFAGRNRAINPEFIFDQINEGAAFAAVGQDVDGWGVAQVGAGVMTRTRVLGADNQYYRNLAVTTADSAIAATDQYASRHIIEGLYCRDFNQGQAIATGFTIFFEYYSTVAGQVLPVAIRNKAGTRTYVTTFQCVAANTWEPKVINVPGDTSGVWATDSTEGLIIDFDHGSGSNFVAPSANAWVAGAYSTVAGVTQQIAQVGLNARIRNFLVEKGINVNPVKEMIPYHQQLQYCQRYFEKSYDQGVAVASAGASGGVTTPTNSGLVNAVVGHINYKTTKRAGLGLVVYNPNTGTAGQMRDSALTASTASVLTATTTGGSVYNANALVANTYAIFHYTANARLI